MTSLICIAIAAGIAVALQGTFMGSLDRAVGSAGTIFITYGVGGVAAALYWLASGGRLDNPREIPWYAWSAGLLGLVIVGGIGYAAPRLGLSATLIVTVAAQLLAAVVIDHFGLFGAPPRAFDVARLAGLLLTVGGVWLIARVPS